MVAQQGDDASAGGVGAALQVANVLEQLGLVVAAVEHVATLDERGVLADPLAVAREIRDVERLLEGCQVAVQVADGEEARGWR